MPPSLTKWNLFTPLSPASWVLKPLHLTRIWSSALIYGAREVWTPATPDCLSAPSCRSCCRDGMLFAEEGGSGTLWLCALGCPRRQRGPEWQRPRKYEARPSWKGHTRVGATQWLAAAVEERARGVDAGRWGDGRETAAEAGANVAKCALAYPREEKASREEAGREGKPRDGAEKKE